MCIAVICFTVYDVINFETNLSFFIKLFFYIDRNKSRQKFKYVKNEAFMVS